MTTADKLFPREPLADMLAEYRDISARVRYLLARQTELGEEMVRYLEGGAVVSCGQMEDER